jgi:hypothetical protein
MNNDTNGVKVDAPVLGYRVDASYFQKWESIPKALRYKAIPLVAAGVLGTVEASDEAQPSEGSDVA